MEVVICSVRGCDFATSDVTEALAIVLLTNHGLAHQNTQLWYFKMYAAVQVPHQYRANIFQAETALADE